MSVDIIHVNQNCDILFTFQRTFCYIPETTFELNYENTPLHTTIAHQRLYFGDTYIALSQRDSCYYGNNPVLSRSNEEGNKHSPAILKWLLLESELAASLCNCRVAFSIVDLWTRFSCSITERERERVSRHVRASWTGN
jgi:hypothetical protein